MAPLAPGVLVSQWTDFLRDVSDSALANITRSFERAKLTIDGKPLRATVPTQFYYGGTPAHLRDDLEATLEGERAVGSAATRVVYAYVWLARQFERGVLGEPMRAVVGLRFIALSVDRYPNGIAENEPGVVTAIENVPHLQIRGRLDRHLSWLDEWDNELNWDDGFALDANDQPLSAWSDFAIDTEITGADDPFVALGLDLWRIGRNVHEEVRQKRIGGTDRNAVIARRDRARRIGVTVAERLNWFELPKDYEPPPPDRWPKDSSDGSPLATLAGVGLALVGLLALLGAKGGA